MSHQPLEPLSTLALKVEAAIKELTSARAYPRPVAGGVVVNGEGQVLLAYSTYAGQGWHFPKGGLDEGETPLECAVREVEEEGGVKTRALPSLPAFDLAGGSTFSEPLAWGSPRGHAGRGKINQGTANLLRDAARRAGVRDEDFEGLKYPLFDLLGKRVRVLWQSVATYFVLAYASDSLATDGESEQVRWVSVEQVKAIPDLHSHARKLLALAGFEEATKEAAQMVGL